MTDKAKSKKGVFRNMKMKRTKNILTIEVDLDEDLGESSTGKNHLCANSGGWGNIIANGKSYGINFCMTRPHAGAEVVTV